MKEYTTTDNMHTKLMDKAVEAYSAELLDTVSKRLEEAIPSQKEAFTAVLLALKAEIKDEKAPVKPSKGRRAAKNPDAPKRAPSDYNLFMKAQMAIEKAKGPGSKQPAMMTTIAKRWSEEKARLAAAAAPAK